MWPLGCLVIKSLLEIDLYLYSKACKSCSLVNDCLPDVCREHRQTMKARVDSVFEDSLETSEADDL